MPTIQESRMEAHKALHAEGKPSRLKVISKADFKETISGVPRVFSSGEVFDHPAPARVKQLLEIGGLVERTDEPTGAEKAKALKTKEVMMDLAEKKLKADAEKKVQALLDALGGLKSKLEKMPLDVLKSEADKRGLSKVANNADALMTAIMEDEQAKLEAA